MIQEYKEYIILNKNKLDLIDIYSNILMRIKEHTGYDIELNNDDIESFKDWILSLSLD